MNIEHLTWNGLIRLLKQRWIKAIPPFVIRYSAVLRSLDHVFSVIRFLIQAIEAWGLIVEVTLAMNSHEV
jgi:hypothetical protein